MAILQNGSVECPCLFLLKNIFHSYGLEEKGFKLTIGDTTVLSRLGTNEVLKQFETAGLLEMSKLR